MIPLADLQNILIYGYPTWESFRGKRVLITGDTGFIGRWIVEGILFANRAMGLKCEVWGISRHESPIPAEKYYRHLILDVQNMGISGIGTADFVIHSAGSSNWLSSEQDCQHYIAGSRALLEFSRLRGVSKFLMLSSGSVEDIKLVYQPGFEYRRGKSTVEGLLSTYRPFMDTTIARIYSVLGAGLPAQFAAHKFILDGIRGKPITLYGDGKSTRSFIYASDLVVWLLTILAKGKSCVPYCVGTSESITILGLAKKIAKHFKTEVIQKPGNMATTHYIPNPLPCKINLGLEISIPLQQAIEKTCEAFKKDPPKFVRVGDNNGDDRATAGNPVVRKKVFPRSE